MRLLLLLHTYTYRYLHTHTCNMGKHSQSPANLAAVTTRKHIPHLTTLQWASLPLTALCSCSNPSLSSRNILGWLPLGWPWDWWPGQCTVSASLSLPPLLVSHPCFTIEASASLASHPCFTTEASASLSLPPLLYNWSISIIKSPTLALQLKHQHPKV